MHNHVIAGDFGYLPVYSDDGSYTYGSEAVEGLKEYVNMIVDSIEGPEKPDQYDSIEDYWIATGVVTDIGTDDIHGTTGVFFNRELASVDYAEIALCYEDCRKEADAAPS